MVTSVDDPEAISYALDFIYFFKYYDIAIEADFGGDAHNRIYIPHFVKELSRTSGISISVYDVENPPESAKLFRDTFRKAGFSIDYEKFYGKMPTNGEFMLTIRYN